MWLAPGRANLMGEHTDYNEGFVLPFALGQGIVAAAARRPADRRLVLCSAQEPGSVVEAGLDGLAPGQVTGWAAYPAGVAWALAAAGYQVPGACLAIDSDVPAGAGLSSSAALECGPRSRWPLAGPAGLAIRRRPPRAGRDRPPGRERLRRGAVRHHGPVRVAAGPARPRAAARLPLAGDLPGAVRPRRVRTHACC